MLERVNKNDFLGLKASDFLVDELSDDEDEDEDELRR